MKERARLATRKKSPVREGHWICRLVSAGLTKLGRTTSSVCSGERPLQTPTASQGEHALRLPRGLKIHQLIVWLVAGTETSVVRPYASGALTPSREKDEKQRPGEGARNSLPSSQQSLSPSRIASLSFVGTSKPSGLGVSGKRTDEGLRAGGPRFFIFLT